MAEPLEFVFSIRSPYSWLAARCVLPKLGPEHRLQWRPFFPLPEFTNFPPVIDGKFQYLIRDITRLCEFYGVTLCWPKPEEPDFKIPHAAFLRADELGRGGELALELSDARFGRGEEVDDPEVLACAAESVGLDPSAIVEASQDEAMHAKLVDQIRKNYDERGIFGVPTLILPRGTRFWGHDRIEWALREGRI